MATRCVTIATLVLISISWMTVEVEGDTVKYNLTIEEMLCEPDGAPKLCLTINQQIPGPTLSCQVGDTVVIQVNNNMQSQSTAIHYHGFSQRGTPFMDGVGMLTQCSILPGQNFVYNFTADRAGTFWYHSHQGVQYGDGISGPFVVYDKNDPYLQSYVSDQVLFIQDWFPVDTISILKFTKTQGYARYVPPPPNIDFENVTKIAYQSGLINGKGFFNCSQFHQQNIFSLFPCADTNTNNYSTFAIQKGQGLRLRIINGGTTYAFLFSIDQHKLMVISADGHPVQPQLVDEILVSVSERYDVIVVGDQDPTQTYWIRATTTNLVGQIKAVLYYQGYNQTQLPTSSPSSNIKLLDNNSLRSSPELGEQPQFFTTSLNYTLAKISTSSNMEIWLMNGISFMMPMQPYFDGPSHPDTITEKIELGEIVKFTFFNPTNNDAHPFHLHGHAFWILGTGNLSTISNSDNYLNFNYSVYRDTVIVPAFGWATILFVADNPGFWMFHCHVGNIFFLFFSFSLFLFFFSFSLFSLFLFFLFFSFHSKMNHKNFCQITIQKINNNDFLKINE